MSSAMRKSQKRLKRRLGLTDEMAGTVIKAIEENTMAKREAAKSMAPEIVSTVEKKLREQWMPEVQGELILYVLAYLHCECGFGEKRIRRFLHEFNTFGDIMRRDGVRSPEIIEMIREECGGLDIVEEFRRCDAESEEMAQAMGGCG